MLLSTWDTMPRDQLLSIFEKFHIAGVEEMRTNDHLLARMAPMVINDLAMACHYHHKPLPKLDSSITSFAGQADNIGDPGASRIYNVTTKHT